MCLSTHFSFVQLHRKCYSALDENRRLKQDESRLLTSINMHDQKCKELEVKCKKIKEDTEETIKERIANQRTKYKEFKVQLNEIIKALSKESDADVSMYNHAHR